MSKNYRKGFALVWVVLFSSALFLSIIGIVLRVAPQNQILVSSANSKRSLAVAEAGLSQAIFDIRNTDFANNTILPTNVNHYLTVAKVKEIVKNPPNHVTDCGEYVYSTNPYSTYWVKIKRLPTGDQNVWDPDTVVDGEKHIYVRVYSLGTIYDGPSKSKVIARSAIKTEYGITYVKKNQYTPTNQNQAFSYAVFSGSDIEFGGNSKAIDGSIYSGGIVDLGSSPSKVRVQNGNLESVGGWVGKGQVTGSKAQVQDKGFPQLNLAYYKDLADRFKTGQYPYNGTVSGFPNTTNPTLQAIIQSYLGSPGTSSTVDGIQKFYNDLKNGTGLFLGVNPTTLSNLRDNIKAVVYYLDADSPLNGGNGNGKIDIGEQIKINANFNCQGAIVINGDLFINGNANVTNEGGLAILVNGDIIKSNGNGNLTGLFYATGGITFGTGSFSITGSIVTKEKVTVSGDYTITFSPITNMPNLDITGEAFTVKNSIKEVQESKSAWEQVSFNEFTNP